MLISLPLRRWLAPLTLLACAPVMAQQDTAAPRLAASAAAPAVDSTESFSLVLAGLKAWLEHGIQLKLISDRHPDPHAFAARRA